MSDQVILRGHCGLGDHLICNGLVRVLVQRGESLILPCFRHNEPSVRAMFADLGEAVEVRPIDTERELIDMKGPASNLGYYGERFDAPRWDESFYRQAGVPFLAKWNAFYCPIIDGIGVPPQGQRFIHDHPARGFYIPMEGYRPLWRATIFDHVREMWSAPEIHCISSSFAILADLINPPGKKFLHRYARADTLPIFGREWTFLEKPL